MSYSLLYISGQVLGPVMLILHSFSGMEIIRCMASELYLVRYVVGWCNHHLSCSWSQSILISILFLCLYKEYAFNHLGGSTYRSGVLSKGLRIIQMLQNHSNFFTVLYPVLKLKQFCYIWIVPVSFIHNN